MTLPSRSTTRTAIPKFKRGWKFWKNETDHYVNAIKKALNDRGKPVTEGSWWETQFRKVKAQGDLQTKAIALLELLLKKGNEDSLQPSNKPLSEKSYSDLSKTLTEPYPPYEKLGLEKVTDNTLSRVPHEKLGLEKVTDNTFTPLTNEAREKAGLPLLVKISDNQKRRFSGTSAYHLARRFRLSNQKPAPPRESRNSKRPAGVHGYDRQSISSSTSSASSSRKPGFGSDSSIISSIASSASAEERKKNTSSSSRTPPRRTRQH